MFNFSLYPYARWLGDGSLDDVPGFNIGESEVPPGNGASVGGMFAAPPMPQYPSWPRTLGSTGEPEACANVYRWTLATSGVAAYAARVRGSRP
jgi:hypothetical protein